MTLSTFVERRRRFARRALLSATTILCSGLAATAMAQTTPRTSSPQPHSQVDANGVDLIRGTLNLTDIGASIGGGGHGMAYVRNWVENGWRDDYTITAATDDQYIVSFGGSSIQFTDTGNGFVSSDGTGATLAYVPNTGGYKFTGADGTVVVFNNYVGQGYTVASNLGLAASVTKPSGETLSFSYKTVTVCNDPTEQPCPAYTKMSRLISVVSNAGYQLKYQYAQNTASDLDSLPAWLQITNVTLFNTNVDNCSASADSCTFSRAWPTLGFGVTTSGNNQVQTSIDALNRTTTYTLNASSQIIGVRRPGSSSDDVTITYDASNRVASFTRNGVQWTYGYADNGSIRTTTVTDALGHHRVVTSDTNIQRITSDQDALGYVTSFGYDANTRLTEVDLPEGNKALTGYDARGNVTSTTMKAKPGSGLGDISTSAGYDASCGNLTTCNSPNWSKDANGNQTDFAYNASTGQTASVTASAGSSGSRPQTRYSYASVSGVSVLTGVSRCQTQASCSGSSDEVKSTVGYGNNLLPTSTSTGAGDGSLTATTSVRYDAVGNVIASIDAAGSETDSTFDADREPLAAISPDPDGSGPLNRRAVVLHYIPDGSVDSRSVGSTDASGTQFTPLRIAVYGYDAAHRLVRETDETDNSGNTVFAVTQYGFDEHGNPNCTAVRMNRAVFNSLPDACTASTQGSDGPDRITRVTSRDALNRVAEVTSAYGTGDASVERVNYTANGLVQNVRDAAGNRTSFEYDGFDRSYTTHYPVSVAGADTSDAGNFEQYGYDANCNLTSRRTRAGQVFGYTYDALNRLTVKTVPSGMRNVFYAYDLLGRPTEARFDSPTGGDAVLAGYDVLGRPASSTTSMGGTSRTLGYQYDITGNRTQITHPDGVVFGTSYDLLGEMKNASWTVNGSTTPFMSVTYDDLGRRTDINRGSSYTGTNFAGTPFVVNMDQRFKNGVGTRDTASRTTPPGRSPGRPATTTTLPIPARATRTARMRQTG